MHQWFKCSAADILIIEMQPEHYSPPKHSPHAYFYQ